MASARWASLILLVALAGTRARAETSPPGRLRATAVWGDDRYVSGGTSQTALSSDGRRVAVSTTGGVIIWDVTGGPEVRIPMPATTWTNMLLAFGAGDRVLLTAREKELTAWDAATGAKRGGVALTGFGRVEIVLGPGTSLAAVWDLDDDRGKFRMEIWDVERGQRVQTIAEERRPYAVTFTGGGRRLFVQHSATQFINNPEVQTLWNIADGKVLYRDRIGGFCNNDSCEPVTAVLAPDGRTLVRAFQEAPPADRDVAAVLKELRKGSFPARRIELVDLDAGKVTVLERPTVALPLSLAEDGRTLACAATEPGQIAIWNLDRRTRRTFKLTETAAQRLQLSPRGTRVLAGGNTSATDGWLSLYRTDDGRRLWEKQHLPPRDARSTDLKIDDAAGLLVCFYACRSPTDDRLVGWDAVSGAEAFALPPTGQRIWLSTRAGPLVPNFWGGLDLRAPTAPWASVRTAPAPVHRAPVTRLVVSPDGKQLASAGADGRVLIRNLTAPSEIVELPDQGPASDLAFRPDRGALAVAYPGRAVLWDLAKRAPLAEQKWTGNAAVGGAPASRLLAGGRQVAFDPYGRPLEIRSLDDGRAIESLARPCGPRRASIDAIDFTGAGLCATFEGEFAGGLRVLRTGAVRAHVKTKPNMASGMAVAVSRDGARALVSHHGGGASLASLAGAGRVLALPVHDAETPALAFSPDGRRAFTGSIDGVVRMWDASTGALIDSFSMSERIDRPTSMAWAPDGRALFVGTARGLIHRMEVAP